MAIRLIRNFGENPPSATTNLAILQVASTSSLPYSDSPSNRRLTSQSRTSRFHIMAPSTSKSACANCGKGAELTCSGCKDTPTINDHVKPIYYCSPTRKMLYRAGSVLQEIFYMYREHMFDKLVVKMEKTEGRVHLYEGIYDPVYLSDIQCLIPFPTGLCQTAEDKMSLLVQLACDDASAWLDELIIYILSGIASSIKEIGCLPKNSRLEMISVSCDGTIPITNFGHELIKVKLLNGGEEFALDLSSAQYGYFEPVVPWSYYVSSRVRDFVIHPNFNYFGGVRDRFLEAITHKTPEGGATRLNNEIERLLLHATKEWEKEVSMNMHSLLKLPLEQFKIMEKSLVDDNAHYIRESLKIFRKRAEDYKAEVAGRNSAGSTQE
ncbi:hypothetical protein VTL71DRAFT_2978 [Oculimacula yallundae]|uniref:Uncharacterized protein n=1 Tax=Oculimacula yallundae TaxID=86028 RepID=A0ABR4C5W1_9HELO